jgi:hypothetical protein
MVRGQLWMSGRGKKTRWRRSPRIGESPRGTRRPIRRAGQDSGPMGLTGTGPPYAKFGRHVRYRLRDVVAWEAKQLDEHNRDSA